MALLDPDDQSADTANRKQYEEDYFYMEVRMITDPSHPVSLGM